MNEAVKSIKTNKNYLIVGMLVFFYIESEKQLMYNHLKQA